MTVCIYLMTCLSSLIINTDAIIFPSQGQLKNGVKRSYLRVGGDLLAEMQ